MKKGDWIYAVLQVHLRHKRARVMPPPRFAIAAAAARLATPIVIAKLRDWVVVTAAAATTGVLFAVYPLVHSPVGMGLCSALLGMSFGCVQPIVMSLLHHITPEHRQGEAVAMRILMINASSVAMPLLFG